MIYAVQHDGAFTGWKSATAHDINGKVVKYDLNVDGWAPKTDGGGYYYWPAGKMSFAASSPADLECAGATRTYGEHGVTIENFEVNANAEHHYDLLYSNRTLDMTAEDMMDGASYYSGIPIDFKHALSSVRFSIKNESEANVFLTSIKVFGVKYKGTFEEQLNEATNVQDPKWTLGDEKIASAAAYIGFQGSVQFQSSPMYVAQLAAEDTDAPSEVEKCNQLLLMPQELTDDATVVVTYTVNGSERSKTAKLNAGIDVLGNPVSVWDPGVRYTYRLVYGKAAADQDRIYFAPGAAEWTDHEVVVVEL